MRGYGRDEYEDWDEYEEDGEEQEEGEEGGEDEYEETQQPTQEELEYLSLRQKIKESYRERLKKDLGTANSGSTNKTNAFRNDKFGSFFGPSQPVIAQRVIQESRSLLENPNLAAKIAKSTHKSNKMPVSGPVRPKSIANNKPNVTNGLKNRAEMLKNTRDYSFLLSEDADVPASSKSPPPRNASAPKSGVRLLYAFWFFGGLEDARSAHLLPRCKPVVTDRGRECSDVRDGRKPMLASSHGKPKVGLEKPTHAGKSSIEYRKQLGSNNGIGPGRSLGPKSVPSKNSMDTTRKLTQQPVAKKTISGNHNPTSSSVQSFARKPAPLNLQSGSHRPTPSHGQASQLKRSLAQREYQETSRPKVISKPALPASRDQLKQSTSRVPSRAPLRDERPKAKPKSQLQRGNSGGGIRNLIRQMFRYDPTKFKDDDDDSDMEANFDEIQKEEKRSSLIARKEDEEEQRKIEEEERREKMRLAKKRKLSRE